MDFRAPGIKPRLCKFMPLPAPASSMDTHGQNRALSKPDSHALPCPLKQGHWKASPSAWFPLQPPQGGPQHPISPEAARRSGAAELGGAAPSHQGTPSPQLSKKGLGQRLWQQHDHMAWPQPSCLCGILQESLVSEDVGRREEAEVLPPSVLRTGAAADKPKGGVDMHTGGGKTRPAFCFVTF